ncbi:hypothetical protein B0J11DRAFT_617129 [Dendryphion nanum]|uniref:DUF3176 domain containing protein n=1 Tax=Dendryphion nanum TaxID=256645 RepID=A0A9P9DE26_9PLEO|nr:hypothetical protein B0J11DRAFT_617129 [Dendryphion nanum]
MAGRSVNVNGRDRYSEEIVRRTQNATLPVQNPQVISSTAGSNQNQFTGSQSPNSTAQDSQDAYSGGDQFPRKLARATTTFYDRVITDWWWWELLSLGVSFLCVSTIVGVLAYYDGRRQSDVVPGVTINGFIAVFAAVAKAALILPVSEAIGQLKWIWYQEERNLWDFCMFDGASRGPWGSVVLLLRLKYRHIASIGAIITILALAFEPFFQQIVTYPQRSVSVGHGQVWTATSFAINPELTMESNVQQILRDPSVILTVESAFKSNNETTKPAPSSCPSGNCTWPLYSTLGLCHECKDLSHLVQYSCDNTSLIADKKIWLFGGILTYFCGYTLNDSMVTGMHGYKSSEVLYLNAFSVGAIARNTGSSRQHGGSNTYWNSTFFADAKFPVMNFYVAYTPGGPVEAVNNRTPVLVECLMSWCTKTIKSVHSEGVLYEEIVDSLTIQPKEDVYVNGTGETIPISFTTKDKRTMTIQNGTTQFLRKQLAAQLFLKLGDASSGTFYNITGFWGFHQKPPYDINPYLDNVTTALTNVFRSRVQETEMVEGVAWGPEVYVSIRWAWLSLPALLLLQSLVLVFVTIWKSRSKPSESWKSSALCTLLHGLTEEGRDQFGSMLPISEKEAASQKVLVKLASHNGSMRLVHCNQSRSSGPTPTI